MLIQVSGKRSNLLGWLGRHVLIGPVDGHGATVEQKQDNRLAQGMTLGIDATVRYAVNKWTEPLTTADLEVDSPYNTRKLTGLPPTPICNPGEATLQAALEPADGDWLYYVLKDTTGNHFFTASYDEFLQAKENQPGP